MQNKYQTKYGDALIQRIIKEVSLVGLIEAFYKTNFDDPKIKISNSINRQFRSNRCAFHSSGYDIKDFYINDNEKYFYCYGCGKNGNCIDFLYETYVENYDSAIKILARLIGYNLGRLNGFEKKVYNNLALNYKDYIKRYEESDKNTLHLYYQIECGIREAIETGYIFEYGYEKTIKVLSSRYCCTKDLVEECFSGLIDKIDYDSIKYIGAKEFLEYKVNYSHSEFLKSGNINYIDALNKQNENVLLKKISYNKDDDLPF